MTSDGLIALTQGGRAPLALEERTRAMRDYLDRRLEANTKRAYEGDLRAWIAFCEFRGHQAQAPDPLTVTEYVRHLVDEGKALKTVERRIHGLRGAFKAAGRIFPGEASAAALYALGVARKDIMREPGKRGRGKAAPFTVPELRAMSATQPDTLKGIRDRAILLLGFAIGARRSELANLHLGDVTEVSAGLEVHVRWSKSGEERFPKVPYGQRLITCPVRAWKAWLENSGLTEGPGFRRIDRHGNLPGPISADGIGDVVIESAGRAGLGHRTAHGLRSGMATEARRARHDLISIARQGGWREDSREMLGYIHSIDQWEDNPLHGIGL